MSLQFEAQNSVSMQLETTIDTPQEDSLLILKPTLNCDILKAFKEHESFEDKKCLFLDKDLIINANLGILINKFLKGIPPNDQELQQLNEIERELFNLVRDKKIWTDEERNKGMIHLNANDKTVKRGKRSEESQKLFFKKAYAFIESKFFRARIKNKKKIQKRHKNYQEFYTHYFSETAKELDIDLENFYHPQKSFKKRSVKKASKNIKKNSTTNIIIPGQKSFNKTYIELILKSNSFKKDLEIYLNDHFMKDCEENRIQKIMKFLNHCTKIKDDICLMHSITTPHSNNLKKQVLFALRKYVLKDSKAKIPWSDDEIHQAFSLCKGLLQGLNSEIS